MVSKGELLVDDEERGDEEFMIIPGRTTKVIDVGDGVITIRNCAPPKVYLNVHYEKKKPS